MIIPQIRGRGISVPHSLVKTFENSAAINVRDYDVSMLPEIHGTEGSDISKPYSYTADYLAYDRCPRQYMIFRKYGLIPSRSQTMFFGSLVHNTIEDLHHEIISRRNSK